MRLIALIAFVVALAGCASEKPTETDKTLTANTVGVLFTVDGITVYRFGDQGRYHYFAVQTGRPNTVTLTGWSESCGKGCSKQVNEAINLLVAR